MIYLNNMGALSEALESSRAEKAQIISSIYTSTGCPIILVSPEDYDRIFHHLKSQIKYTVIDPDSNENGD